MFSSFGIPCRRCAQFVCTEVTYAYTPGILDNVYGTKFWVYYSGGLLELGLGWAFNVNGLVRYNDPTPWAVRDIRVGGGYDIAHWRFPTGRFLSVAFY